MHDHNLRRSSCPLLKLQNTRAATTRLFARSRFGFPDAELTELRRRIHATRWPERETVTDDS
jgi:hypothetical protein